MKYLVPRATLERTPHSVNEPFSIFLYNDNTMCWYTFDLVPEDEQPKDGLGVLIETPPTYWQQVFVRVG